MPLTVIRNDITKIQTDAVVNAANPELKAGGGVCGMIFNAAGAEKLQKACDKLSPINTGQAVITKGFDLPAKYIVHTAGPVYKDGMQNEENQLRACYINALTVAKKHGCKSIAFPLISSGIYGYPKKEALSVATDAISGWLMRNEMDVSLVVFDKDAFQLSGDLLGDVKSFINEAHAEEQRKLYSYREAQNMESCRLFDTGSLPKLVFAEDMDLMKTDSALMTPRYSDIMKPQARETKPDFPVVGAPQPNYTSQAMPYKKTKPFLQKKQFSDVVGRLDEPFSSTLLRLIDAKGKTDVEVYKRANLDRKLFSKIRKGKGYMPSKKTAVALAIALELSLAETRDLMERAGFALSRSVVFDVIIEYFITHRKYDIFEINNVLFEYDQQLLGG